MIASGLQLTNSRIPQLRKPVAFTRFVLNSDGVSAVMEVVEEHRKYGPVDNIRI